MCGETLKTLAAVALSRYIIARSLNCDRGRESESSAERRGKKYTHAYYYYMRTDRHLSREIFFWGKKTDAKGSPVSPDRETLPSEKYISEQDLVARLPLSSVECGGLLRQQVALCRIGRKRRRRRQFGGEKGEGLSEVEKGETLRQEEGAQQQTVPQPEKRTEERVGEGRYLQW